MAVYIDTRIDKIYKPQVLLTRIIQSDAKLDVNCSGTVTIDRTPRTNFSKHSAPQREMNTGASDRYIGHVKFRLKVA